MDTVPPNEGRGPSRFERFMEKLSKLSEAEQKKLLIESCKLRFEVTECEVEIEGPEERQIVTLILNTPAARIEAPMDREDAVDIWTALGAALFPYAPPGEEDRS